MQNKWVKFDPAQAGAEKPFTVRWAKQPNEKSARTEVVVLNQFNQILSADDRRLIEDLPPEMNLGLPVNEPEKEPEAE